MELKDQLPVSPGTHWIWVWRREELLHCRESSPGFPNRSLSLYRPSYIASHVIQIVTISLHKDKTIFTCIAAEWIQKLFVPNHRDGFNIQWTGEEHLEFLPFCSKIFDCFFCYSFVTVSMALTRIQWKVCPSETLTHSRMLYKKGTEWNSNCVAWEHYYLWFTSELRGGGAKLTSSLIRTTQQNHLGQDLPLLWRISESLLRQSTGFIIQLITLSQGL
jgi:hypothetical protein